VRIAYSPTLGYAKVDPEVASIVDSAVRSFQQLGASVELVEQPFDDPTSVFRKIWYSGVALAVAAIPAHKRSLMDPELLYMLEAGERLPHMEYMHATLERAKLGIRMNQFHEQFDLLITPAMPIAAFDVSVQVPDPSVQKNWIDWTPFTYPFNLTHQPAAVMPCGFTAAGLPVGMQIVAKVYADALVLRAAWAFESMQPIVLPPAPRASA
jgi:aspartyl-tRNA(Asn)/glutamyl-tRNA(Gln) amidotransferase subunit A